MSAPPFRLLYTDETKSILRELAARNQPKSQKVVLKTLRLLRDSGPAHPALSWCKSHSRKGPNGEDLWESYVENRTPGAWRIWRIYGPAADTITIVTIGPHT